MGPLILYLLRLKTHCILLVVVLVQSNTATWTFRSFYLIALSAAERWMISFRRLRLLVPVALCFLGIFDLRPILTFVCCCSSSFFTKCVVLAHSANVTSRCCSWWVPCFRIALFGLFAGVSDGGRNGVVSNMLHKSVPSSGGIISFSVPILCRLLVLLLLLLGLRNDTKFLNEN